MSIFNNQFKINNTAEQKLQNSNNEVNQRNNKFKMLKQQQSSLLGRRLQSSLKALIKSLLPSSQIQSIHDLFNSQRFHDLLIAVLPEQIESAINTSLPSEKDSYLHTQVASFLKITQIISDSFKRLQLSRKQWPNQKELTKMVKDFDLNVLQMLLGGIFTILTHKQSIVLTITTLDQCDQKQIQGFILKSRDGIQVEQIAQQGKQKQQYENGSNKALYDQLQNLQNALSDKQGQVSHLKSELHHLAEQNEQVKCLLQQKCKDLQVMRKRLIAFQEVQTLLSEKDNELEALQAKLQKAELKNKTNTNQITQKQQELIQKNRHYQNKLADLQSRYNKIKEQAQEVRIREENKDLANKKVIANLKEKVKQIQEKNGEQQRQLLQIIEDKQAKDKQYRELLFKYEGRQAKVENQDSFRKQNQSRGGKSGCRNLGDQLKQLSNYQSHSMNQDQDEECQKPDCKELRKEYSQIINRIVNSLNLPESAACRALHQKRSILQNYANKLGDISNQNQKLKQRLVGTANSQNQSQDVVRLKKKILVLKKRMRDQESRRKQEMDIMAAVLQQLAQQKIVSSEK